MTEQQQKEFENLANPLIKWLNENTNPHAIALIDTNSAQVMYGEFGFTNDEFILD